MPIEIRELVIRATVNTQSQPQEGAGGAGGLQGNSPQIRQLEETVKEILTVLKEDKNER